MERIFWVTLSGSNELLMRRDSQSREELRSSLRIVLRSVHRLQPSLLQDCRKDSVRGTLR